jgi:enoyl-CoA hydratase/carnithine racemase
MRSFHRLLCSLQTYPAPVICAVRGYAVGGAVELLLFSDFVVASSNSTFGFPEINNGLLPAAKGIREAARRLGSRAAKRLLFSGELVTTETALALGLVDEVCAVEDVEKRGLALAQEWGGKDPALLAALRRSVNLTDDLTDDELEEMSIVDMRAYLARSETSEARIRFLDRKKSA